MLLPHTLHLPDGGARISPPAFPRPASDCEPSIGYKLASQLIRFRSVMATRTRPSTMSKPPTGNFSGAQRVFQQDSVLVDNPCLKASQIKWRRMRQRRVVWTGHANPALHLIELHHERIQFLFRSGCLDRGVLAAQ